MLVEVDDTFGDGEIVGIGDLVIIQEVKNKTENLVPSWLLSTALSH